MRGPPTGAVIGQGTSWDQTVHMEVRVEELVQDIVLDIPPINSQAQERLGYPTQKPVAFPERSINVSSNALRCGQLGGSAEVFNTLDWSPLLLGS